jgi:ubiquinone/menaquinone biosynthesis C-methylase UbiE
MTRRTRRWLFTAAALFIGVPALLGAAAWWFERGPGFRRQCDRLVSVAEIRPGMVVADVGAGDGRVAARVASRLGAAGRLYATEITDVRRSEIRKRAADEGISNIVALNAGEEVTGLPSNCCDAIYLRRVYHHLSNAEAIASGLYAAVRPGGRLVVVEMSTPKWLPDSLQHGIEPAPVRKTVEAAGFQFERRIDWWSPIDYALVFRKGAP